jgi:hypothetical protein
MHNSTLVTDIAKNASIPLLPEGQCHQDDQGDDWDLSLTVASNRIHHSLLWSEIPWRHISSADGRQHGLHTQDNEGFHLLPLFRCYIL